jgi:hypothetical protein
MTMKRSCLLLAAVLAAGAVHAQTPSEPGTAPSTQPARTESQQLAFDKLMDMARFLGKADHLSVSMRVNYDVVQESGEKIEFGERRDILLQRPDKLRIVESFDGGDSGRVLFDGKDIMVFNSGAKVFAKAPQPGSIDQAVVYFVRDLQMRLPIAPLLLTTFADELQRRVERVDYVGRTDFLGEPTHQIAVRATQVDFQMWISDTPQPLPLRVVITYRSEPGQPQFRADFSNWNLSPSVVESDFAFTPPADARQIAFAAQLTPPPAKTPAPGTPAKQGAKP